MLTKISNCAALYIRHFLAQSIRPGPRLVPPIQAQAAPQKSRQSTVKTLVFSRILKCLAKLVVSGGMKPTNERRQICKYPIKYLRVTGWRKSLFQPRKSVGKSREPENNAPTLHPNASRAAYPMTNPVIIIAIHARKGRRGNFWPNPPTRQDPTKNAPIRIPILVNDV